MEACTLQSTGVKLVARGSGSTLIKFQDASAQRLSLFVKTLLQLYGMAVNLNWNVEKIKRSVLDEH